MTEHSKPVLHGTPVSPYVRKVRVALAEKGIDYELDPLNISNVSDEYRKISPLGKVPCWEEGDFALPDSSAILAYLERRQPEPQLYPSEARAYARALWYEEYADTKLRDVCTLPFWERVVRGKFMGQEPDEGEVSRVLGEEVPVVFGYLEQELAGRDFLCGERLSVADIAVASMFVNFAYGGESLDAERWPRLAEYVARIHGRPSYAAILEEERALLPL